MQGCGKEYYALGNTKILMMPEPRAVIDACKKKASEQRDLKATTLKQAFTLFMAPRAHEKKVRACLFIQARYKLKYYKKQKAAAEIFRANFEKAIIEYKAEKRKAFEQ
jgi:hypothetical protein